MTDEELANLRRLADAATTAPLNSYYSISDAEWAYYDGDADGKIVFVVPDDGKARQATADARYIYAAYCAVPALLDALAAMTQCAEAAEAKLAVLLGADKPNKIATPTQIMRHWMLVASEEKHRRERAEHQLAAVPWESLVYCWKHEEDWEYNVWVNHSSIVDNWLHVYMPAPEDQP